MRKSTKFLLLVMSIGMTSVMYGAEDPETFRAPWDVVNLPTCDDNNQNHRLDVLEHMNRWLTEQNQLLTQRMTQLEKQIVSVNAQKQSALQAIEERYNNLNVLYQTLQHTQRQNSSGLLGEITELKRQLEALKQQSSHIINNNNGSGNFTINNHNAWRMPQALHRIGYNLIRYRTLFKLGLFCVPWSQGWNNMTYGLFGIMAVGKMLYAKKEQIFERCFVLIVGATTAMCATCIMAYAQDETTTKIAFWMIPISYGLAISSV